MSPPPYDVVVIGGGHNGLVCAGLLARAGLRVVVVERREVTGGAAATTEIAPGIRAPGVAHSVERLDARTVGALSLPRHGLVLIEPDVVAFAPQTRGRPVTLWSDSVRTAAELGDDGYLALDRRVRALSAWLEKLFRTTPFDLKDPGIGAALSGVGLARAWRRLGPDARELLRALPMAVADFVSELISSESIRGAVAARGIRYCSAGPWSAGTTAQLLAESTGGGGAAGRTVFVRGGPGALAAALTDAARALGAEIRTASEVAAIHSREGRVLGVALTSGEELTAAAVCSGADPKHTLLDLVDPLELGPTLRWRVGNLRTSGVTAKLNLALSEVPKFAGADGDARIRGRVLVAPDIDYLERAFDDSKYGRFSDAPYLEATIPSLSDDSLCDGRAHVMSVLVQYAPYRLRDSTWQESRDALQKVVLETLETYAPGLSDLVVDSHLLTPVDLEQDYGLTEGAPLHGEPGLDQFFSWRPLLGHARYRLALEGLYLCGSGAHPGGGLTGLPGANAAREILLDFRRGAVPLASS